MSFELPDFKYLNVEKNFTCPDFHTCTLMDSLATCGETLSSGVKGICQAVSTQFVEFMKTPGYNYFAGTGMVFSGPDKAMAIVYPEIIDRIKTFASDHLNPFTVTGVGQLQFEIVSKNFICPDFYTCKLVGSLASCEEKIRAEAKDICQVVSTNFVEFIGKTCSRSCRRLNCDYLCFKPTGKNFSGPDMAVALVHHETMEKVYNFVIENSIWLAFAGLGAAVLAYGTYSLVKKGSTPIPETNPITPSTIPNNPERNHFMSRLHYGKEVIWNVARIVRDIALTVFYSCLIFSKTWNEDLTSSFQNVRYDFSNLAIAAFGIVSPSRAAISI